ncbi:MAG: hypothetical protein AB2L20_12220 [Mangrovibacterium sp.]
MRRIFKGLILVMLVFGIIEFAYVLMFPSKGIETFPVVCITDGATIKITCPEEILHHKADRALEAKVVQGKTLEVRLKQPGDKMLVTVASENYFASWHFIYLPDKGPSEVDTTIVMTEKDKTDKAWSIYKKLVNQLDSF